MSDFEVPARSRPQPPDAPRLSDMRVRYIPGPLLERDVASSPFDQFRRWLADALELGVPEPNAMVLSTVDASGRPGGRHVLLKELDSTGFVFYTNLGSRKARALNAHPVASLCFPWFVMARQVSVVGRVEPVDRASAAAYWALRPRESQLGAWASRQSQVVESREALRERLASVARQFPADEAVPLPDFWGGYRVVPDEVELWQGQPGRMHDRLRYSRQSGGWRLTRLQP
jgi:pyridoxamine 5'-phosphate oxidase